MNIQEEWELHKPKKKTWGRFLRVIFGRTTFVITALLIQLVILCLSFQWLREHVFYLYGGFVGLSAVVVIYIINKNQNPSYQLSWIIPVLVFPVFGALFYLFVETQPGTRAIDRRLKEIIKETESMLRQRPEVMERLYRESRGTARLAYYMNRYGGYPIWENTSAQYFPLGDDMYPVLLEELRKAERYIFMEYFIIGEGYVWDTVLEVLRKKVKEGVEVRLMYDGTCSISLLPYEYPKQLREYGIQCKEFGPIIPILSTSQNNRDHRKICVIDGKVAFTGGVNLADEYINKKVRFGHWKDTAIKIEGDAVQSFTMMFLQMWNITERQPEDYAKYLTEKQPGFSRKDGYIIPYGDSPFDHENVGEEVYFHILNHAKKYVHIMTPYLILDNEMIDALTRAAKGGIEVQIIMPHIPDKPYAFYLAKTYYEELIAGGVEIYEYTPGFVHAKVFTSDDDTATVGSINLDYRSLYLHFECGVFIYRNPVVRDIEKDFQDTLAKCQKVTMTEVRNRSTFVKIYGQVLRLVAPLM